MVTVSYSFHGRAIELACALQGEYNRDIGIALASDPSRVITVLAMHGPAEMVAAAGMDDETFIIDRIGQAEMTHELHGTLTDALKRS